jgi:glutathione S-transferase
MTKLYYTPTSCASSSFMAAFISELNFDCEIVDLTTHTTESGIDFYTINPKGNVPTLILNDGTILNENISCLEYILDQQYLKYNEYSDMKYLGPNNYTTERYIMKQNLSFIASELHPILGLLFSSKVNNDIYIRNFIIDIFDKKMKYLEKYMINDKDFILNDYLTIVDLYLHIVLSWTWYVNIDLSKYSKAHKYYKKISNLDKIKNAKNRMFLMPKTII